MKLFLLHTSFWGKRLLIALTIVMLLFLVCFFRVPEFHLGKMMISDKLYEYTNSLGLQIYLVEYFIGVFVFNSLLLITLTILYKYRHQKNEILLQKYRTVFVESVINYLLSKTFDSSKDEEINIYKIQRCLKDKNTIVLLLDVLRRIHSLVKGDMRPEINKLIDQFNLHKEIHLHLHSPYLKDKILALKFISGFQLVGYLDDVVKLTFSKKQVLRTEAFISLIKIGLLGNLTFLKKQNVEISMWDFNAIANASREFDVHDINYHGLIQSDNPRVAALGILLANKHRRIEFRELIKNRLGSSDELLNHEAWLAFSTMADRTSDFKLMTEKFRDEKRKIKQIIIASLIRCPDKKMATYFLMSVVESECLQLKTAAMKLLMEIDANKLQLYRFHKVSDVVKAHREALDFHIN